MKRKAYRLYDIFLDGSFEWLASGNALEVIDSASANRIAAWCFGVTVGEHATYITAVCEFRYEGYSKLIVATAVPSNNTALLCLFDIETSLVTKVVEIPHRVSYVTFIEWLSLIICNVVF